MDAALADVAQLWWDDELRISAAEGACEHVLRRGASELEGQALHEALGVRADVAGELDARAESGGVQFVRCQFGELAVWLRLSLARAGDLRTAAAMDLDSVLAGAPPLQISRLSSSLSHEIRNPLSSVKMAVQTLARNQALSDRDRRRLAIANREIRTMERMLWLLSEYGRDSPPMREPVALRALVAEAASLVELELSERRIDVRIDGPEDLPKCPIDAARLRPVLAQLLLNVAMGLSAGSVIEVRLERASMAQRLVLPDPSATLPVEERARLFEPFGSMLARGAGLSLAALHRVMVGHGGSIAAESAERGSVYTLTFPS